MCAIAGILGLHASESVAKRILATMKRRGPDGDGFFFGEDCTLIHARLAVIDPEGGAQPMHLEWAGERYTIVYNGELYNTEEIRHELKNRGHRFAGHSDTEVLLHGYAQWGEEILQQCNGIFAFAVWEHRRKRLFLARDRMGVKPCFYKIHEGGFLFASEIKSILAYPTVKAEVGPEGIAEIVLLGPGRTPGCGVFRGIQELEPGCCGYYEDGCFHAHVYWKLLDREHTESFGETAEHVRYLVTDAIRRQMVSDVPIGTFLSGGLDSSLITAVCAGEMKQKGQTLQTFSVDYKDQEKHFIPNKFQPNSDSHYIRIMQEELQTQHQWCVLSPEDLLSELDSGTYARDLPGMADVDFSLLAFCKRIKEHVTVALSGECADEIFGGYPWFRDPEVRALDGFPWAQNTAYRCAMMAPDAAKQIDGADYVRQRYLDTCRSSDILPGTSDTDRRTKEMVNLNMRWFMQTLLDRKDRMSMYSGLEVRVPFCDYRIAEYLYGVPWEYKDYQGKEKGLLRSALSDFLPLDVLWRKKSPYPKTFDPGYLRLVTDRLQEILMKKDSPLFAIVNRKEAEKVISWESPWPWYGQLMRRPQLIAFLLQIDSWMRQYHVDVIT